MARMSQDSPRRHKGYGMAATSQRDLSPSILCDVPGAATMVIETRREWLKTIAAFSSGAVINTLLPSRAWPAQAQDRLAAFRAQVGAAPIQTRQLDDTLTLLSGPGGNVLVLHGADGLVVVDTFVAPAWPKLQDSLKG